MIHYVSTRGVAPRLGFADVLLAGLASDGGLYVPEALPPLAPVDPRRGYAEVAADVMWPFVEGAVDRSDFDALVTDAYASFDVDEVCPLVDLGDGHLLLELFHGPTLAFKDVALQLVGRLFDHELTRRDERVVIVGATSGDTGSAAIEACRDRDRIDIVVLFPAGRVSEVQRRQMTTVDAPNVHAVAVEGTFDDCQDLVKGLFADEAFRARTNLSAVNSINWARVMAQIVYYPWAAALAGVDSPTFCVPTGNFGNVYAGHVARRMGLALERLVLASNANDILTRLLETGEMVAAEVVPTLSPSMDIQISSNLERLLFELHDGDGAAVADLLTRFRSTGRAELGPDRLERLRAGFAGERLDDTATLGVIADVHRRHGLLVDPHTAVGLGVARRLRRDGETVITLATAHPAKFPDAVESATGVRPALPPRLADLFDRPERYETVPAELGAVAALVDRVRR